MGTPIRMCSQRDYTAMAQMKVLIHCFAATILNNPLHNYGTAHSDSIWHLPLSKKRLDRQVH